MKTDSSHFLESPHTQVGWWAVGLSGLFTILFLLTLNELLIFSGFLTMVFGLMGGGLTLFSLAWKHERSWLLWLMLLPGLFAITLALASILIPH